MGSCASASWVRQQLLQACLQLLSLLVLVHMYMDAALSLSGYRLTLRILPSHPHPVCSRQPARPACHRVAAERVQPAVPHL